MCPNDTCNEYFIFLFLTFRPRGKTHPETPLSAELGVDAYHHTWALIEVERWISTVNEPAGLFVKSYSPLDRMPRECRRDGYVRPERQINLSNKYPRIHASLVKSRDGDATVYMYVCRYTYVCVFRVLWPYYGDVGLCSKAEETRILNCVRMYAHTLPWIGAGL